MKKQSSSESGQILILLVLVIIGLLGFTALAIDGGMIFADRRYTQSAADAASLAGAGAAAEIVQANGVNSVSWSCSDSAIASSILEAETGAVSSAINNDYKDVKVYPDVGADGQVLVTCSDVGEYIDVEVTLFRKTNTSFVHLFTGGEMRNAVYSKTRVRPILKAGEGNSIVALGDKCEKNEGGGVHFDSGSQVAIFNDGGIYSNTCVLTNGFKADVTVNGGGVTCHEGYDCQVTEDNNGVDPYYDPGTHWLTGVELIENFAERCSSDSYDQAKNESVIWPGNYSQIIQTTGDLEMKPGLYCVNDEFSINTNGVLLAEGVTIYYTSTKSITINGGAGTILTAPDSPDHPPVPNAVEDVLLYIPTNVKVKEITINGNSNNVFGGTIFAPNCDFTLNGNAETGDLDAAISIIGRTFKISGNNTLELRYEEDKDFGWPSFLQVQK